MTAPIALYTDIAELEPTIGIERLESEGWEVRVARSAAPEAIARLGHDADALLIGYSPVTAQLLERLPRLRIVATQSVGVETVDLDACAARGVAVSNVPGAATEEVATHALALALALTRGLPFYDRATKLGEWDACQPGVARLSTLTVGVIGLGQIGRRFARLASPLFGRVVGYDPVGFPAKEAERLPLDDLLRMSDLVSVHLPLTLQTRHLLDEERLALLPAGARVVNVARGPIIDSAALLGALESGALGAVALDVLEQEPPAADDPLVRHPRALVTPHAGFFSPESGRDYILHQAENAISMIRTGRPVTPVDRK